MGSVRAVVVDDEPLARKRLLRLLRQHSDVEIVAECENGRDAINAIQRLAPDLVFLDVQMPGVDGFDVIARVGADQMPVVVFITAFSQHAIRAFEVEALDFLLKPFDAQRLTTAVNRARRQIAQRTANDVKGYRRLLKAMGKVELPPKHIHRLLIKSKGRIVILRADEIDWIGAAGKYVRAYSGRDYHLLRESMQNLEHKLDPDRFARIHRSTIVNLDAVVEFQPLFHGELRAILRSGTELVVSRRYRAKLDLRFKLLD